MYRSAVYWKLFILKPLILPNSLKHLFLPAKITGWMLCSIICTIKSSAFYCYKVLCCNTQRFGILDKKIKVRHGIRYKEFNPTISTNFLLLHSVRIFISLWPFAMILKNKLPWLLGAKHQKDCINEIIWPIYRRKYQEL